MANALVQHNLPLSASKHLTPLMTELFPDSEIAKRFRSRSTKTTCMINIAMAPYYKSKNCMYSLFGLLVIIPLLKVIFGFHWEICSLCKMHYAKYK